MGEAGAIARPQRTQGMLFGDPLPQLDTDSGYRGPVACRAAGITYRQFDYRAHTRPVEPSIRSVKGSGSQWPYSFRGTLALKVIKRLLDTGVSPQQIRTAVNASHSHGVEDLASIALMSDGASVHECTSADEVIDLVAGGQGVFGITVRQVWHEVEGALADLPVSHAQTLGTPLAEDELAKRRAAKRQQAIWALRGAQHHQDACSLKLEPQRRFQPSTCSD